MQGINVSGKNVVVTGKIAGESRISAEQKLREAGAQVHSSVTNRTELLITGASVGATKLRAAEARGASVVPWEQVNWNGGGSDAPLPDHLAHSRKATPKRAAKPRVARAKPARQIGPMLALGAELPSGDGWLYEVKWDGVRCIATVAGGVVSLQSRSGKSDYNERYPQIVAALEGLEDCILDGELVVLDESGASSFQKLIGKGNGLGARYIVFDLLAAEPQGEAIKGWPLTVRRSLLERLVGELASPIVGVSPTFEDGDALLATCREKGLEGLVAKRKSSIYKEGHRGQEWIKVKVRCEQEFVVVGYTPGEGAREGLIGSLVLAVLEDEPSNPRTGEHSFILAGHAGSGITGTENKRLLGELKAIKNDVPLVKLSDKDRKEAKRDGVTWVRPSLVVQVEFQRWTIDNRLWHPTYKGQRLDKSPAKVRREPCAGE
jgi:bifunctional non-homologous end joining protein LigD